MCSYQDKLGKMRELTIDLATPKNLSKGTFVQPKTEGCTTAQEPQRGPKSPNRQALSTASARIGRTNS